MSFEDQVKARARHLDKEKKAQQESEKRAKTQFLSDCQATWDQVIGGDWPPVKWTVMYDFEFGAYGYGSFTYKSHRWIVSPDFRTQPITWTWHESTVSSPLNHSKSNSETLRDDLLTALANPPRKPKGFQPFD
ncbi:MAG: hypothetical protein ACRDHZ_00060 [Ktedonobacteraceae bacterium]